MASKEAHRTKLVEYLADPDNPILTRKELATKILGFKNPQGIHQAFSAQELDAIEKEALGIRRGKYASALAKVDAGLLKRAAEGDPAAARLAYQKFEGWSEKTNLNLKGTFDIAQLLTPEEEAFLDEFIENQIKNKGKS